MNKYLTAKNTRKDLVYLAHKAGDELIEFAIPFKIDELKAFSAHTTDELVFFRIRRISMGKFWTERFKAKIDGSIEMASWEAKVSNLEQVSSLFHNPFYKQIAPGEMMQEIARVVKGIFMFPPVAASFRKDDAIKIIQA